MTSFLDKMISASEIAKDYELDSIGSKFSLRRRKSETDLEFRTRIINYLKYRKQKEKLEIRNDR